MANLAHDGDPKAAARGAATMLEFVANQVRLLEGRSERGARRRAIHSRHVPRFDPRLWLDDRQWLAWTLEGDLVAVEEMDPATGRGSPRVRRVTDDERRQVSACGRLVDQVIKLYPGDNLDRPPVLRYLAHNDLKGALKAALTTVSVGAAQMEAGRCVAGRGGGEPVGAAASGVQARTDGPHRKTRFDPAGNYILFRPPAGAERLAPFLAILPGTPVQVAFPDRRSAQRGRERLGRLGVQADGLQVARVLGSVLVEPVFRRDIQLPRFAEELVALVRSEPRVVVPELHVAWLPRYVEDGGNWTLQQFRNERTVRRAWQGMILRELGDHVQRLAPQLEQNDIRRRLGADELRVDGADLTSKLVQRAGRRVPRNWLERIGMEPGTVAPQLNVLQARSFAPPTSEDGHWVRAPFEFRAQGVRKPQRHLVELRIDDLAGLLELVGFRFRCLLIRESPQHEPRWVLPIGELECLVVGVA